MISLIFEFLREISLYFNEFYESHFEYGSIFQIRETSKGFSFAINETDFFFIVFLIFFAVLFFKFIKWFIIKLFSLIINHMLLFINEKLLK